MQRRMLTVEELGAEHTIPMCRIDRVSGFEDTAARRRTIGEIEIEEVVACGYRHLLVDVSRASSVESKKKMSDFGIWIPQI